MSLDALFRLHSGLPRQGPGSDAATLDALSLVPRPPARARVLDLGCGPGRAALVLAAALDRPRITAIDLHEPFLRALETAAAARGVPIETRRADMLETGEPPGSVDLVWCEGAAYSVGFERALRSFRDLLRAGGSAVVSELSWTVERPSAACASFFEAAYPPMTTIAENSARAEAAGFRVLASRRVPEEAWWREYYDPLEARCEALAPDAARDADLAGVIREAREEIAMRRRFASEYDYVFFALAKR